MEPGNPLASLIHSDPKSLWLEEGLSGRVVPIHRLHPFYFQRFTVYLFDTRKKKPYTSRSKFLNWRKKNGKNIQPGDEYFN